MRCTCVRLLQILIAALALGGCRPTLSVGTTLSYPPLTFVEDGEPRGVEIEFAQRLARELGRGLEIERLPIDELIPALEAGRVDVVMAGLSVTPQRSRDALFCDPYLQVGQMALIRTDEFQLRSERENIDQPGVTIGVKAGTTGEDFVHSRIQQAKIAVFESPDQGIAALREGRVDYFVHDAPTIWRIVGGFGSDETQLTGLYRPLTDEHLAWAVRSGNSALAGELNAALDLWRAEGFVEQVLARWIPVRKITIDAPSGSIEAP